MHYRRLCVSSSGLHHHRQLRLSPDHWERLDRLSGSGRGGRPHRPVRQRGDNGPALFITGDMIRSVTVSTDSSS